MQPEGAGVLVTGGASGLGLATARRLAAAGAHVVVLDRQSPGCSMTGDALGVSFRRGDVSSEDDVSAALRAASDAPVGLRIVVSCAAVLSSAAVVDWRRKPHPLDSFDRTIRTNLIGTFNVLRLGAACMAGQDLLDEERGVIVNTASIAAVDGQRGQCAYAASKAGITGMTLPAARDLAPHRIRVVSIAPGFFDTPMLAAVPDDVRRPMVKHVQHPARVGRPDEFASLVCHIVGNQMINGEVVRIDGGVRLPPS